MAVLIKQKSMNQHFKHKSNMLLITGEIPIAMPQMYDYFFDDEKLEWIPWNQLVPAYIHDPERKFIDILVPTLDTVRATWLLNLQVGAHYFFSFQISRGLKVGKKILVY